MKNKTNDNQQLQLFGEEEFRHVIKRPARNGGSGNPIVFHDYESFVAKFSENPKTTDDCYTPKDVYEAVVDYVHMKWPRTRGMQVLRPFYPGGDYETAEYPEDGVVIDNPPFSIFTRIARFYTAHGVPFFLFGPGLTIFSVCKYCTAVVADASVRFENGAMVGISFATNLAGDLVAMTAPELDKSLRLLPSQNTKANLATYAYPEEMVTVSEMRTMAHGGQHFEVRRDECQIIRTLDNAPRKGLFGDRLLVGSEKAAAKAAAKVAAKAAAKAAIPIPLSEREKKIVARLGETDMT